MAWISPRHRRFGKIRIDAGKDVTRKLDLSKARRPLQAQRRVNVDFPDWMIERLDKEARRLGVTRQSIIKIWLSERLEMVARKQEQSSTP